MHIQFCILIIIFSVKDLRTLYFIDLRDKLTKVPGNDFHFRNVKTCWILFSFVFRTGLKR